MGKSGEVDQPSSIAPSLDTGGVQSFASGSVSHVPLVPDWEVREQLVPSVGRRSISNVGVGVAAVLEPPPLPLSIVTCHVVDFDTVGSGLATSRILIAELMVPRLEPIVISTLLM